ncbi:MAG: hypothetical protein U0Q16_26320 [Bryobacteraceae bacterium]
MKHLRTLALAAFALVASLGTQPAPAFAQAPNQKLVGSWLISITVDGAAAPFTIDMATFDGQGGLTVISSDRSESSAVGSYQRTGDREFLSTHTHIVYNDKGTFSGIAKVIATEKLSESGDSLAGRFRVEISDVNGKVVAKIVGTISGKPVVPEPL